MATYVVGDLQGCLTPLHCLLECVDFQPSHDLLWLAGDLINRGPQSLETLRYLKSLSDEFNCIKVALGNHDLHLLACAYSDFSPKPSDTLNEILAANDKTELLDWLRQQPLAISDGKHLVVHAGIAPMWSVNETLKLAKEVEAALQGKHFKDFFDGMYGNTPVLWSDQLQGIERLRCITNYLTRMRYCHHNGSLDFQEKCSPTKLNNTSKLTPWFNLLDEQNKEHSIIFGHWASLLGECEIENLYALDTGCVWGGKMRMLRLSDKKIFECNCE